jgi:2-polyprenyl-3-methyl-5-hydroxy-6-metoxy-1,4-benzoquinol methylase
MDSFYSTRNTDIPELDERLRLVAELAVRDSPMRILDIACGRGVLLTELRRRLPSAQVHGSDVSGPSVEYVRSKGFDAAIGDVTQRLPYDDEAFDCIIFGEIIEHVVDPDHALQEISRVLTKGGRLVITTPNLASWFNRLLLLAGIQPIFTETSIHVNLGRRLRALGQWRPTQGHLKIFTRASLEEMLAANGFLIERTLGAPFAEPNPFSGLDSAIARIPSLASNLVIDARNSRTLQTTYKRLPGWH